MDDIELFGELFKLFLIEFFFVAEEKLEVLDL